MKALGQSYVSVFTSRKPFLRDGDRVLMEEGLRAAPWVRATVSGDRGAADLDAGCVSAAA